MKLKKTLLACLIPFALLAGCNSNSDTTVTAPNQGVFDPVERTSYSVIIENLKSDILDNSSANDNKVSQLLVSFNLQTGTYSDIEYYQDNKKNLTDDEAREVRQHLYNLSTLSVAYNSKSSQYYLNDEVRNQVRLGLQFWLDEDYESNNWWWRDIGFPTAFSTSAILMNSSFNYLLGFNDNLGIYLTHGLENNNQNTTGANMIDFANLGMQGGAILEDDSILNDAKDAMNTTFKIVDDQALEGDKRAGLQVDYSFSQHSGNGMQLYLANYGVAYFAGIVEYMQATQGTKFAMDESKLELLDDAFLEGNAWSVYQHSYDQNVTGRFIGAKKTDRLVSLLSDIIELNTPKQADLKNLYQWMENGNDPDHYLEGNKFFWTHDYMVHRRANYFTSVKMSSSRTVGNEYLNNTGAFNLHTGDNVNYVMVDGDEYGSSENPFFYNNNSFNWRKLPGITAQQISIENKPLLLPEAGQHQLGESNFAIGVSDGYSGAAATIFNNHGIREKKAWFFFDHYYVVIGRDLNATLNEEQGVLVDVDGQYDETITNQSVTNNGSGYISTVINQSVADSENGVQYLTIFDGNEYTTALNDNIGYIIKGDSTAIKESKDKGIFSLEISHGQTPVNAESEYAVYPDINYNELISRADNKPYNVNSETNNEGETTILSVIDTDEKLKYIVFYQAGVIEVNGDLISSSEPVIMMIDESLPDQMIITVSQNYSQVKLTNDVTVNINDTEYLFNFEAGLQSGKSVSKKVNN